MKNRRFFRIISCMLALMLVLLSVPGTLISVAAKAGAIDWSFDPETGILTVSGTGDMPDYSGYSNVPWDAHREDIIGVVIEEGITRIGNYSFTAVPNLTQVEIPSSVISIGASSLAYCDSLTSITLSENVAQLDLAALVNNQQMTTIEVSPENPYFSSVDGVLFNKDQSILIAYPAGREEEFYSIPETVAVIDSFAFYACVRIIGLGVPESVTDIKKYGLAYTSNLSYVVYGGTEDMWNSIFCEEGWREGLAANVPGEAAVLTYVGSVQESYSGVCGEDLTWHLDTNTQILTITGTGDMDDFVDKAAPWRRYRKYISSVTIESGVTSIGDYAFEGCGAMIGITLPDTLKRIGRRAFYECIFLSLITLPYGLQEIEDQAFYYCVRLSSLYIPSGITRIEDGTFYGCLSLKSINLPANITSIGNQAFARCEVLENIYYAGRKAQWDGVTKGTDWDLNAGMNSTYGTYQVNCAPDADTSGICGQNLTWNFDTETGKLTISGTGKMVEFSLINVPWDPWADYIKEVEIQDGVTSIGSYGFYGCEYLTKVRIPSGVTSVGTWAFASCNSLTEIRLPDTVTSIGVSAFGLSLSLQKVTLPKGLTSIPNYAFSGCTALTDINFPESLTAIGEDAFSETALTEIVIPDGVTTISARVFWRMKNLHTVTIHKGITTIDKQAFEGCTALETIYYKGNEQQWEQITKNENWDNGAGSETVSGQYSVVFLNEPDATGSCGENITWEYWESEQRLLISGSGAMTDWTLDAPAPWNEYRSSIKEVTISPGVTTVGDYAFYNVPMTEVSLPQGITRIGNYAFYGNAFTEISLPPGLTTIGEYSFYGCTQITELVLPEGLTSLEQYAFGRCYGLTSVTIPKTVTWIASSPFAWCSVLADIYYSGNNVGWYEISKDTRWASGIGSETESGTYTLHFEEPNQYSGRCGENLTWTFSKEEKLLTITGTGEMFGWSSTQKPTWQDYIPEIQVVEIGEGVTSVGSYAFYNHTALTTVYMPVGVTKIESSAFAQSSVLSDIYYEGSKNEWSAITKTNGWDGKAGSDTENGSYTLHYGKENSYSGTFGDGFSWVYWEEQKLLEISGAGDMPDWDATGMVPWVEHRSVITKLVLDPRITGIGKNSFSSCSSLTEIVGMDNVTRIGGRAFYKCSGLTEITFSENLATIEEYAFGECSKLTEIHLPQSVSGIGQYAFAYCYSLADVYYPGSKSELQGILNNTTFYCAGQQTVNGTCSFHYGKENILTGSCGENLIWTCWEERGILEITGEGAMDNWSSASSVPWHSVRSSITTVTLDERITTIGGYAFYGMTGMTEIQIHQGVTSIGAYAFYNCDGLTAIQIPDSVTFMGEKSLGTCRYLDDIYYEGNSREWNAIIKNSGVTPFDTLTGYWTENGKYTIRYGRPIDYYTGSCGENLIWKFWVESGLLEITGEGAMDDWAYSQPWSAYKTEIQKVTIDDAVTHIGDFAFYGHSSLTEINIPEELTSIGEYAFYECSGITELTIPESVTSIEDYTFYGCSGVVELTIPEQVTTIGNYAFYGCNGLNEYHIPEDILSIGSGAFGNCQYLSDVYFFGNNQDWDKIVAGNPFDFNTGALTEKGTYTIHYGKPHFYTGSCGENLVWELTEGENILRITGSGAMENWSNYLQVPWSDYRGMIEAVEFGPEVTSIGNYAFQMCNNLVEVTIPQSVKDIGNEAFYFCSKLEKVILSEGVEVIGTEAFYSCSALKFVYLPESLYWIGTSAFQSCGALADIYYSGSRAGFDAITKGSNWDKSTGSSTTNRTYTLHIAKAEVASGQCGENLTWNYQVEEKLLTITGTGPMDVWTAANQVPWNEYRSSIQKVVMGDDVTTVGDYAFLNCYNLAEVTVSQKLTSIGKDAFSSCHALSEFTIPETVTELGEYCFWVCKNLTEITIPSGVTAIPKDAFNGCSSLVEVNLHEGILSIGDSAFSQTSSLRELEIPSKVTSIGSYAFERSGIYEIVIPEGVTSIGTKTFYKCNALTSVQLPETVTEIGEYAFECCNELEEIKIPEKVKVINNYTFKDCASLKEVEIPKGVTRIGIGGFYGSGIRTIYIPSTVTSIGSGAFSSCLYLADIYFEGSETKWKAMNPSNMVDTITGYYAPAGTYTVHYNFGSTHRVIFTDWDGTVLKSEEVPHGLAATPPADPVREGYTFDGWSKTFDNVTDDLAVTARYTMVFDFGNFDDGFTWTYWAETGKLVITGEGDMPVWESYTRTPWYSHRLEIKAVEIGEGITSVSDNVFLYYSALKELKLPKSLKKIGKRAFDGCEKLTEVNLPAGITELDNRAFGNCMSLQTIYYQGNAKQWERVTLGTSSIPTRTQIVFCEYEMELSEKAVSVHTNATEGIVLVVASYREGRLVASKQMVVTGTCEYKLGSAGLNLSFGSGDTVKAFLWSDTNACDPLCESKEIQIP